MRIYLLFFAYLSCLMACEQKEMTLAELKNASWSKLDKGVDYISLKNGHTASPDSIRFNAKGFLSAGRDVSRDLLMEMMMLLDTAFKQLTIERLPDSKHGYLRINFDEMLAPDSLKAYIYLKGNIDSVVFNQGINDIRTVKGVINVQYVSPDMAKEKYLADGNEDWSKVLDTNPLPASIAIHFDKKIVTSENYETFKKQISAPLELYISAVETPKLLLNKSYASDLILEYHRY